MGLFLFSEDNRTLLIEIKVLPSVQPSVSIRNPNLYACFAWSYTFASSSTFFEWQRSNMESSIVRTLTRSSESRGDYGVFNNACCKYCCKTYPVNLNHLHKTIYGILRKRRCIFASDKAHIHAPVGKYQKK